MDPTDPATENRDLERGIPEKLSLLRQKLSQKAKQEPKFRFYTLYGRISRWSQRPFRPPEGTTGYEQLTRLGLLRL